MPRQFDRIFAMAAERKGGPKALEKLLPHPKSAAALARILTTAGLPQ